VEVLKFQVLSSEVCTLISNENNPLLEAALYGVGGHKTLTPPNAIMNYQLDDFNESHYDIYTIGDFPLWYFFDCHQQYQNGGRAKSLVPFHVEC
jgi:hypothetical protein